MAYRDENIMFDGSITHTAPTRSRNELFFTPILYGNDIPDVEWINLEEDDHFLGDGSSAIYYLDERGFPGSTKLWANTDRHSLGSYPWLRRTDKSAIAGNWKYQEVLDDDGYVVGIEPRDVFDMNMMFTVFYKPVS